MRSRLLRIAPVPAGSHTARAMPEPPSADRSDEALMLAYAGGHASAFDTLYARHKGPAYRYVLRHCGNAARMYRR